MRKFNFFGQTPLPSYTHLIAWFARAYDLLYALPRSFAIFSSLKKMYGMYSQPMQY